VALPCAGAPLTYKPFKYILNCDGSANILVTSTIIIITMPSSNPPAPGTTTIPTTINIVPCCSSNPEMNSILTALTRAPIVSSVVYKRAPKGMSLSKLGRRYESHAHEANTNPAYVERKTGRARCGTFRPSASATARSLVASHACCRQCITHVLRIIQRWDHASLLVSRSESCLSSARVLTLAATSFLSIPYGERQSIMSGPANTAFTCALGGEEVLPSEPVCCIDDTNARTPFPFPAPIFSCGSCFGIFKRYRGELRPRDVEDRAMLRS
jgi:hypothetical protein